MGRKPNKTPIINRICLVGSALSVSALILLSGPESQSAWVKSSITLMPASDCGQIRDQLLELTAEQLVNNYRYWSPNPQRHPRIRGRHHPRKLRTPSDMLRSRRSSMPRAAAGRSSDQAESAPAPSLSSNTAKGNGPGNFTRTNNQERGVDEADLIKTDGKYIYTVRGEELLVLRSWPPSSTSIVSRLKLGGSATKLFLRGDRLAVFSSVHRTRYHKRWRSQRSRREWDGQGRPIYRKVQQRKLPHGVQVTRISLVDIGSRSQPRVVRQYEIDGQLHQGLMIGKEINLVSTTNGLNLPSQLMSKVKISKSQWPRRDGRALTAEQWKRYRGRLKRQIKRQLRRVLTTAAIRQALPQQSRLDGQGNIVSTSPLLRCDQIYLPRELHQPGMINVTQLDIERPTQLASTGVVARGWRVYASKRNLYVATREVQRPNTSGQQAQPGTQIHKFALSGVAGRPQYVAAGRVRGQLLNQFSMSEHQGHLRVATTNVNWRSSRTGGNNLFVLRESGGRLHTVGELTGLAKGERIYGARMFGDKGYIVTFRQTDPLYTIDLSNPEAPRVVGELKVNGFSSYIHPLGKNSLLTIGQDADDRGRRLGMHLQIFDVSNFARPVRTHHYRLTKQRDNSSSTAQNNHHAFTYDPHTRTLAIPLAYNNYQARDAFNGLLLLKVGEQRGFTEIGKVSHASFYIQQQMRNCQRSNSCARFKQANYLYSAQTHAPIQRSVVMDNFIYSLSNYGLKVHALKSSGAELAAVSFMR